MRLIVAAERRGPSAAAQSAHEQPKLARTIRHKEPNVCTHSVSKGVHALAQYNESENQNGFFSIRFCSKYSMRAIKRSCSVLA